MLSPRGGMWGMERRGEVEETGAVAPVWEFWFIVYELKLPSTSAPPRLQSGWLAKGRGGDCCFLKVPRSFPPG